MEKAQLMFSLSETQKWVALSVLQTLVVLASGVWPVLYKETHLRLAVRYSHVPVGFTVVHPSTKTVEVLVQGLKFRVNEAKKRPMDYVLDLSSCKSGFNTFAFDPENILLPKGLSVIRTRHATLMVKLDSKIRKKLPVEVVISGKPGIGYEVESVETEPQQVWVEGPQTLLEPLNALKTKPLDIANADESISKDAVPDLSEGLTILPSGAGISAKIMIREKIITKIFKSVPVQGRNTGYEIDIRPSGIRLIVKGPFKTLDAFGSEKGLEVFIDLSGSIPGQYKRYATIRLPVEMVLVDAEPRWFDVNIHPPLKKRAKKEATHAAGR